MDERTGYGGGYDYDYDYGEEELESDAHHGHEEHRLESHQDPAGDPDYADGAAAEDFLEQDRVEHQVDHANDDGRQTNFGDKFDDWRKRVRARRQGHFVPPDTRGYKGPVFIRVQDVQDRPQEAALEPYIPLYHNDPEDEELAAVLSDEFQQNLDGH